MEEARNIIPEAASWTPNSDASCERIQIAGASADRIRAADWSLTELGPISDWDPMLVSTLNLILASRFPIFLTWGVEHRMFYNDAYEAALSGKGDCIGRRFREVFPEAWSTVGPMLEQAFSGQPAYKEDLEVPLTRNATLARTWWSFCYSPIKDERGAVQGVMGIVYETTRRFLAEQALWSSEAALRAVTDMAPALLWRCEANGVLSWANQPLQAYAGVRGGDALRFHEMVHPEDLNAAGEEEKRAIVTGDSFEGQYRLRETNGRYRWFHVRRRQIRAGDGSLSGWCGSAVDIDEWRSGVDGLTEKDELFRQFSGSDATLMWTADVEKREVQGLNPEFRSAWALPPNGDPVPWEAWVGMVHPEDRAPMDGSLDRIAAGETLQGKFRTLAADGAVRWFHCTAFPIPAEDGVVRRIGGLLVDVTREADPRVYLIRSDPAGQNQLSHLFTRADFKVRAFDDVSAFTRVSDDLMPGVVVLAVDEGGETMARAAGVLGLGGRRLPWIALGSFDHHLDEVVRLMKLGASDVLELGTEGDALVAAVRAALPPRERSTGGNTGARQKLAELSRREREVLEGLVGGGTNKTIALALSLSPRTVETYRAQLMDRLGVRTLAELLRIAGDAAA